MRISEAVKQLREIQEELGDIEIKAMVQSDAFERDGHNLYLV